VDTEERGVWHARKARTSRGRARSAADDPSPKDSRVSNDEQRIRVGVLLGGASAEREISLASGRMIAQYLPRDRYEVIPFDSLALMAGNPALSADLAQKAQALLAHAGGHEELADRDRELPAAFQQEIQSAAAAAAPATDALQIVEGKRRIDVAFIALHGPYGEDGTLQGMLEIVGIPYVGSGVLASALAMDKAMAAKMLAAEGIPVAQAVVIELAERDEETMRRAAALIPAFVKPSRQGSSVGMSPVSRPQELGPAVEMAFEYDSRVLVEERLEGREITVGVIGNRRLTALPVVEIVSSREFFDYRAKYDPALSEEICPAELAPDVIQVAQDLALRAHRALDCRGYSRVDMILTADRGPVVLEVNTLPGMTINSLFPKAAAAAGIPFGELLDRLVRLALGEE
jgi:D-alanine-D-alanine ligase